MGNDELIKSVTAKATTWLSADYDEETRAEVQKMLDSEDKTELIECFYKDLEFGTGGLRGIMGVGSNRMNIYTVGSATQGLANYLKDAFKDKEEIKVVVGHDVRNNSRKFAEITANIFSANGIKVYLFEDCRPTPEISFAIRELGCQSGVVITASHNPKEYNGYKIYDESGCQLVPKEADKVIEEINKIEEFLNAATMIEPKGIYYYFWAYIKFDYFKRKFLQTSPNYSQMLEMAKKYQVSNYDISQLFSILNVENPFKG